MNRVAGMAAVLVGVWIAADSVSARQRGSSERPASADTLLAAARKTAAAEQKTIFVKFGASWCGPCQQLDALLGAPEIARIMTANYVSVRLTVWERGPRAILDNPGAETLMSNLGGGTGIPFYAFLDSAGKKIGAGGGYPGGSQDVREFLDLIGRTGPRITPASLQSLAAAVTTYGTGLGELSGRVLDDRAQPIRGASVSAIGSTYANGTWRPSIVGTARTDDRGEYTLTNLEAGQYRLVAEATGPAPYAGFFPAGPTLAAAQPVTLRRGEGLVGLNLTARRTAMPAVSGVVVSASGARVAHAMVTLANVDWPARTYQATADATGAFKLPPVSAGRYHLWARGPSTPDLRGEIGRLAITLDRASAEPVTLRTSPGATLAGVVTLEGVMAPDDRRGVRLVAVAVNPDPGAPTLKLQSPIGEDGRFAIHGVFGARVLRADGLPSGWFVKAVQADGVTTTDAALDISGKPPASLQVVLSNRSAEIRGQVLDSSGGVATSGSVVVFPDDPQAWQYPSRFVKLAAIQPTGTFRVTGLPTGRYLVAARVSVGRFWDAPESLAALRADAANVTIDRPGAASITARIVAATLPAPR